MGSSGKPPPSAIEDDDVELLETDPTKVLDCLDKVLRSSTFRDDPTLQRLMDYLARAALDGRVDALNERAIGIEVLELGPDFDPHCDPIVARHAKKLWDRLKEYYQDEGLDDPVRIDLEWVFQTCRWGAGRRRRTRKRRQAKALAE